MVVLEICAMTEGGEDEKEFITYRVGVQVSCGMGT